jgi:CTP:molybdopterin cytidylyltransferase MocA
VHWPAVLGMTSGDTGARPFLRAHPDLVTLVECGDVGSPDDVDTPEDLAAGERVGRARHRLDGDRGAAPPGFE